MGKPKLNKEIFIERANEKHNYKFNYDKVIYTNNKAKVIITCPEHGDFEQIAKAHMVGQGCAKCYGNINKTLDEFITKANIVHNYKYSYDKAIYENIMAKIIITCPYHEDFEQVCQSHLNGRGCMKCSGKEKSNVKDFTEKAIKIHGDKYDYSLIVYTNRHTEVTIICKTHGIFNQIASNHLAGQDCPKCAKYTKKSKPEAKIEKYLIKNNIKYVSQYVFNDLKYVNQLYFDFAIFDKNNNLITLIEYNGKQHYTYIKHFHRSLANFEIQLLRDKLKQDYCLQNNINLNIIKYDENILDRMDLII